MTPKQCHRTLAPHAAACFATELLLARCRTGAELAMMPQGRWLGATSQGLYDWLQDGGFACEIETGQRETGPGEAGQRDAGPGEAGNPEGRQWTRQEGAVGGHAKTAASGRRSLVPLGTGEE